MKRPNEGEIEMKIALVDTKSGLSDTSQKKKLSSESSPELVKR